MTGNRHKAFQFHPPPLHTLHTNTESKIALATHYLHIHLVTLNSLPSHSSRNVQWDNTELASSLFVTIYAIATGWYCASYHHRYSTISLQQLCSLTFGANRFSSAIQLGIVDSGAQIRNGPWMPLATRWQIRAIHWIVLPRPISSARIPFTPFSYSIYAHKICKFIKDWAVCCIIHNSSKFQSYSWRNREE